MQPHHVSQCGTDASDRYERASCIQARRESSIQASGVVCWSVLFVCCTRPTDFETKIAVDINAKL